MNSETKRAFIEAFNRRGAVANARANAARAELRKIRRPRVSVAIPLVVVLVAIVGAALIEAGLWPHYKAASVVIGILTMITAPAAIGAIWRAAR